MRRSAPTLRKTRSERYQHLGPSKQIPLPLWLLLSVFVTHCTGSWLLLTLVSDADTQPALAAASELTLLPISLVWPNALASTLWFTLAIPLNALHWTVLLPISWLLLGTYLPQPQQTESSEAEATQSRCRFGLRGVKITSRPILQLFLNSFGHS